MHFLGWRTEASYNIGVRSELILGCLAFLSHCHVCSLGRPCRYTLWIVQHFRYGRSRFGCAIDILGYHLVQFQLEEAVDNEEFQEAAKLKQTIASATASDLVSEVMSGLKVGYISTPAFISAALTR